MAITYKKGTLKDDAGNVLYPTTAVQKLVLFVDGSTAGTSVWDTTNSCIDISIIPDLDASKITSGTLNSARIPDLAASKITTGTLDAARIPSLSPSKISGGTFSTDLIPDLPASKITTGTLDDARIPSLSTSKITSGTFSTSFIPDLSANKITSDTLSVDRIPALSASKITSGTLDAARIPSLSASKITSDTFDAARIPTLTSAKLPSNIVYLGNDNKIDPAYLPSYVEEVIELVNISSETNPQKHGNNVAYTEGQLYYCNASSGTGAGKIRTASVSGSSVTWSDGVTPSESVIYIVTDTEKVYRYGGSTSGLVEISKQIDTATTSTAITTDGNGAKAVAVSGLLDYVSTVLDKKYIVFDAD